MRSTAHLRMAAGPMTLQIKDEVKTQILTSF